MPSKFIDEVLGSDATIDMAKGTPLKMEHILKKLNK
jgi:hypothetical protein